MAIAKELLRILHFEDSTLDAQLIERTLKSGGLYCSVTWAKNGVDFRKALEGGNFDLIVSDYSIPGFDGMSALDLAHKQHPEIPFIFISGTIGEEKAVEALKRGATDYVTKDRLARLVSAIKRAVNDAETLKGRQRAEERIREQAEVLDEAQDAICINDMCQRIRYWNHGAERLYGWKTREVVGKNAIELLFPPDSNNAAAALKNLIRTGAWRGELEQITKDGRAIEVESRWTLMRDKRGKLKSILIINTDITEKKRIETQLQRTQRMESIGALAGGIAHDLNNSLAPIMMAADLLRDELTTDDSKRLMEMIKTSARRSVELVKQVLSFARGTGGDQRVLNVESLIAEVLNLVLETFPRSIMIQSHMASGLQAVKGNSTQLNQVLMNLCINARDAMPNGGSLQIEASNLALDDDEGRKRQQTPGSYVVVSVTDTGDGMAKEVLDRIFEPFFTTKQASQGTGLGLSIVMGIVKTHDGFVEVSSQMGRGTNFKIYLPATLPAGGENGHEIPPRLSVGSGEHILLVDDEIAILEVTKVLLEFLNYKVTVATDGMQAVALYLQHCATINLIVTDLMMPGMSGVEVIHAMRRINPAVKIIAMSGLGAESSLTQSAQPVAQHVLKKPFTTSELVGAIQSVLGCTVGADFSLAKLSQQGGQFECGDG